MKTKEEIYELIDKVSYAKNLGCCAFPGMSYEDGILNALEWITEEYEDSDEGMQELIDKFAELGKTKETNSEEVNNPA